MKLEIIQKNIDQKLADAKTLHTTGSYANAIYLCGYCVELALKKAIVIHQNWEEYPTEGKFRFLKVHDLELLVSLTGKAVHIRSMEAWLVVNRWNEFLRYDDPTVTTEVESRRMLNAVQQILEAV